MKYRIHLLSVILTIASAVACSDEYNVDPAGPVELDITVDNALRFDEENQAYVIRLNDPVSFSFHGNIVDNILFYSGEIGHEYRYRHRDVAAEGADIRPQILIKTSLQNPADGKGAEYRLLVSHDLKDYTDESVEAASWNDAGETDIHKGERTNKDITQYYYPNLGLQDKNNLAEDYEEWLSHDYVVYGIKAKSNEAHYNRLRLSQFDVMNNEARDYSFTLDDVEVVVKKTISHQIFKDMSFYDDAYRVKTTNTAASWAYYTPQTTVLDGSTEEVPNSRYYCWNVAQMGLKYGEGSGFPFVRTNGVGQDIRCSYNTEVWEPNKNIDLGNGTVINAPTDAMKKQPSESWLISRRHPVRYVESDTPSSHIKIKSMNMVWNFSHTFLDCGLYTMTFVVNNQNRVDSYEKVMEYKIIVIE